eukprot:scaffold23310_cov35-Prasinocladus_malaysianus.AAC.1
MLRLIMLLIVYECIVKHRTWPQYTVPTAVVTTSTIKSSVHPLIPVPLLAVVLKSLIPRLP